MNQIQGRVELSFKNKYQLLQWIDNLPMLGPEFEIEIIWFQGDLKNNNDEPIVEELELFYRDPIECIRALLGNLAFSSSLHFGPERVYVDSSKTKQVYNEMWTGNWWWETQVSVCSSYI